MVCDKCQTKLNRVICPDVAKKPMFKAGVASSEETKEESKVPLYKRKQLAQQSAQASEILDFAGVTRETLTESSLINDKSAQRTKSGLNMALLKGREQKRGFDPLSSKCGICKSAAV